MKENENPIISEREIELDMLACRLNAIDEAAYPEMARLIASFLALDGCKRDYRNLADDLVLADPDCPMPERAADFIKTTYIYCIGDGDGMAANNLAAFFYRGRETGTPDYKEAKKYYEIADRLGCRLATENLAYIYYYGQGTEVDYALAYKYFSKAALFGHYEAVYKLGDMYRYGLFVDKDDAMAFECYLKAENLLSNLPQESVDKNWGSIYHRLADCFFFGIGIGASALTALSLYQKAEIGYYKQIAAGDRYHLDGPETVIEKQDECRLKLRGSDC